MNSKVRAIVIGGLNTDIVGSGVSRILGSGELTRSGELLIGPGGKSRNIAHMLGILLGKDQVAMVAKTSRDPFNLWEIPVKALKEAGVNTQFVQILDYETTGKYPGIALIPVSRSGENQIYCLPGINDDFSPQDIEATLTLFDTVAKNRGILALSLEQPLETAVYAVKKAASMGIRVILDPGGIDDTLNYNELLSSGLFAIKPNEHEIEILTDVTVRNFESAERASENLLSRGIRHVMITHGKNGMYYFSEEAKVHIPVPQLKDTGTADETGCGDQTMAVICAEAINETDIVQACRKATVAGSMQFARTGIQPLKNDELEEVYRQLDRPG